MRYLIDASLVAKSLLKEDVKIEGRFKDLLKRAKNEKIELISSKLLSLEVANALRFGIKDQERCVAILKDFALLPIKTFVLSRMQLKQAVLISYNLETTVYDTSYHVLAKAQNAVFLTCDDDYYKKAKKLGDIELVS